MTSAPEEVHEYETLLSRLIAITMERSPRLVGIEGPMASGKTTLAKRVARDLELTHLEADNFAIGLLHPEVPVEQLRGRSYLRALDLDALETELRKALHDRPTVIIDGICLRDVLDTMRLELDAAIYMKVISNNSPLWHFGFDLEDMDSEPSRGRRLDHEVLAYHARARPHEIADLIFVWKESAAAAPK